MTQTWIYILSAVSLVLDIVGAYLIFKGSDKFSQIIAKMGYSTASKMGKFDSLQDPGLFREYWKEVPLATKMNRWGIRLLIAGFVGQIIVALYFAYTTSNT